MYVVCCNRVESFIEHQDACNMGRIRSESHSLPASAAACLSRTASSASPSTETNLSAAAPPWPPLLMPKPIHTNFLITPVSQNSPILPSFLPSTQLLKINQTLFIYFKFYLLFLSSFFTVHYIFSDLTKIE